MAILYIQPIAVIFGGRLSTKEMDAIALSNTVCAPILHEELNLSSKTYKLGWSVITLDCYSITTKCNIILINLTDLFYRFVLQ